ncbi:MAG: hypothetical protein ACRDL7_16000, partial [Gaiellaceae bacterium]
LSSVSGLCVGPDRAVYATIGGRICKIARPFPTNPTGNFTIPSEDGGETYTFDKLGRHLSTRDAMTGGLRYVFNYDSNGQLKSIYDANNDSTLISHNGGSQITITAPHGQPTTLGLTGSYLHTVANPMNETVTLGTDATTGLLGSLTDANNHTHNFHYADDGRLDLDTDPANGSQTMARGTSANNREVKRTTAVGRTTTYDINTAYSGAQLRTTKAPDGTVATWSDSSFGNSWSRLANGLIDTLTVGPSGIPSFGMMAPRLIRRHVILPSGLDRFDDGGQQKKSGDFDVALPSGVWQDSTTTNFQTPATTELTISQSPFSASVATRTPMRRFSSVSID